MFRTALACAGLLVPALSAVPARGAGDDAPSRHRLLEEEKRTVNIYKAYAPSVELARKAAITFHGQLMESNYPAGFLILELDAEDMDKLRRFGFRFEHATDFIARRNQVLSQLQSQQAGRAATTQSGPADASLQSIPNYSCYETVEETFAAAQAFVAARPGLASWIDAGDSWEKTQGAGGHDIGVLKLTNSAVAGSKPRLFVHSAIHAREYTTAPLVLEFARWLVNGHGVPTPPQQAIGLYPTDGTSDAVSYGELGVAAFTIELGTAFLQRDADGLRRHHVGRRDTVGHRHHRAATRRGERNLGQ